MKVQLLADLQAERMSELGESRGRNGKIVVARQNPGNLKDTLRIRIDAPLGMRLSRSEQELGSGHGALLRVSDRAAHHRVVALAKCSRRQAKREEKDSSSHHLPRSLEAPRILLKPASYTRTLSTGSRVKKFGGLDRERTIVAILQKD